MDNKLTYKIKICAVIFGADESLLNINLGNDFIFKKMSLVPSKDNLDSIFETDSMGLRRDYESARIDNDSLDVVCAFKSFKYIVATTDAKEYFNGMCDDILEYLDNKIRAIRLYHEGPVRFKKLSIKMKPENSHSDKIEGIISYNSIIPIGEAMRTKEISKFYCDIEKIQELNENINSIEFHLSDPLLNSCHIYYDLSYHQDNFISVVLLITCLEMLFLNDENAKKERLAKRCSVFSYDTKDDRLECYAKLRSAYKKRSDFVHDGYVAPIKNEDILFLRDCVRKSLVKRIDNKETKKDVIKKLKITIKELDYWNN